MTGCGSARLRMMLPRHFTHGPVCTEDEFQAVLLLFQPLDLGLQPGSLLLQLFSFLHEGFAPEHATLSTMTHALPGNPRALS